MTYINGKLWLLGHRTRFCKWAKNCLLKSEIFKNILHIFFLVLFCVFCSEGGFFKAYLTFPYDYPLRPPKMKFITEIWHPNGKHINYALWWLLVSSLHCVLKWILRHLLLWVCFEFSCNKNHVRTNLVDSFISYTVAKNGDVCISILHEPGEDKFGYEKPEERWLPIHTVETIMISVISMLADPNSDSPANVDAAVSYITYPLFPHL